MPIRLFILCSLFLLSQGTALAQPEARALGPVVLEDFEAYPVGGIPHRWMRTAGRDLKPITPDHMKPTEYFVIKKEGNRKYTQVYTKDEAMVIILPKEAGYTWNLETHPTLRWDWRVHTLPEGGNERESDTNDTGAAVYVTFSFNFWGSPRSIKYVHSATLPVGTTLSYGTLKILVVASGKSQLGQWLTQERDVAADYKRLFGKEPPDEALSVTLWSDSDTLGGETRADFDNLIVLPRKATLRNPNAGPQ